jgi:methylated-DNA-[protein]-cysteine S-methyltransferase
MTARGYALFDTPIGRCGIAWGERGIAGVQLPEAREPATRACLARRFPSARELAPPLDVRRVQDGIAALLRGEPSDLSGVVLDMDRVPPFHRRVYDGAREIPPGATLAYGELAARIGSPGAARAVGQALRRNPFAIIVPCHRVLAANAKIGGFTARGGVATKLRMLALEGAPAGEIAARGALARRRGAPALGFDPAAAIAHLRAADPALARAIDAGPPFELELRTTRSVFVALGEAIVHQQLTTKAAQTIFARLRALFPRGQDGPTPEQILRASDAKLRSAGLSRPKVLALRDLARRAKAGEIPTLAAIRRMDDEAIVERLSRVRGIGRWTAEMLLIFRLGRPDVLPVDDYGLRKGFSVAFRKRELPTRRELERRGERWKPYRTVASWYLWRAAERAKAP